MIQRGIAIDTSRMPSREKSLVSKIPIIVTEDVFNTDYNLATTIEIIFSIVVGGVFHFKWCFVFTIDGI